MTNKAITQKLASVFIAASIMLNFTAPSTDSTSSLQAGSGQDLQAQGVSFDDSFLEAQAMPTGRQAENIDRGIQNIIVGETSFLALKSPPITKQVVLSKMWLFVTAYSSTPDQTDSTPFITAANTHVRDGVVAANFVYFGTKMRFPTLYGDKVFIVEDRMNSRYPYRVDIWMNSREEANQFGVKIVPIEIIREI